MVQNSVQGSIWTLRFWKAAAERAVKTFAQVEITYLATDVLNILKVDWEVAAGIGGGAVLLSILSSLGSSAVTGGGPSLTNEEVLKTPLTGA